MSIQKFSAQDNPEIFAERLLHRPETREQYWDYFNSINPKGDTLNEQVADLVNHYDCIIMFENNEERLNMIACDTINIVQDGGNADEVNKHLSKYGAGIPKLKISSDWESRNAAQNEHRDLIAKKIFELIKERNS